MEVEGAHVAITGGAGGIGSALADEFRRSGAFVVTMDLAGRGADIVLDVTDRAAAERVFSSLERLDVVVANAGVGVAGRVSELDAVDWQRTVDVNLMGTVNTLMAALPRLRQNGHGAMVIMASLSGLVATPLLAPYAMTKHGLVGLGASLRPELAPEHIGVTVVCPGPVETPLLDVESPTPGLSVRRYLTTAGGRPIAPSRLAAAVIDGVRRDRPLVTPGRAWLLWRLERLGPRVTARQIAAIMARQLPH